MDIWNDIGISNKKLEHKCFEVGFLEIKTESGISEIKFNYETLSNDYVQEFGVLGENTKVNKTIYTYNYGLNFCRNARVRFADNTYLTIKDVILEQDSQKAQMGKNTIVGVRIVF